MKKFSLLLTLAIMMVGSTVFAGSIDYLSNQSAKYVMTFHRTASTDASADIANYNPAGTALLAPGLYIDFSNQTLLKYYETTTDKTTAAAYSALKTRGLKEKYEQSEPTLLLPNLYGVYNFGQMGPGKLAAYAHVGVSAGGGTLKWDDGTPAVAGMLLGLAGTSVIASSSFEASSVYYTGHIGASYAFLDDMMSVSLGGKIVNAQRSMKLNANATVGAGYGDIAGEFEYEATGYTAVVGLDVKPIKDLTLAVRYEMETDLEFEYDQKSLSSSVTGVSVTALQTLLAGKGIADGAKTNNNLPAILSLGAEYKVMPELILMTSANIYFLSQADMGKTVNGGVFIKDTNEYYGTGYEFGLGATYIVMPELKVGAGFMYTESGAKDEYFDNANTFLNAAGNPPLDSYTIGLGATYTVITNLDLTLACSWTHYLPEEYTVPTTTAGVNLGGEYKKDVYNIALGVGYKI